MSTLTLRLPLFRDQSAFLSPYGGQSAAASHSDVPRTVHYDYMLTSEMFSKSPLLLHDQHCFYYRNYTNLYSTTHKTALLVTTETLCHFM
jgi:hypothetical protein